MQPASIAGQASVPAHNTQNNTTPGSTTAQHAQGQATQNQTTQNQAAQTTPTAAQTPAQAGAAASQLQAIAPHNATHEIATPGGSAGAATGTAAASERPAQAETNEAAATQGISTANVIQKMSGTEMRVGMHSAEFGEISIRTAVSQQQMTAQISVDHDDLGKAISAHIPAMEARLGGELGLRALVQVSQSGMSFSGERGASPQKDQRTFAQPQQAEAIPAFAETDSPVSRAAAIAGDGYRLDIRA